MIKKLCILFALGSLGSSSALATPLTLEGMNRITSWTDVEGQLGDMPDFIWGTSDTDGADEVGIFVRYENGVTGTATYSGVSGVWNSIFSNISPDTATGFFAGANLHFLFNVAETNTYPEALPMAWANANGPYSGNFDLDYNDQNYGTSDFRASVGGWGFAEIATYSSTAQSAAVPETGSTLALFGLAFVGLGFWRRFFG
jgi:hypothetical protein